MSLYIPALNQPRIRHGILIRISVNGVVYRIANTYSPITYQGEVYQALGHFLGMNEIQDDIRTTNNLLRISLSGIPADTGEPDTPSYIALVLQQNIKGSLVQVWRIFFDPDTNEFLEAQTSLRFSGYINNYTITDGLDEIGMINTRTVIVQCSNVNSIIERRIAGRRTNSTDQNFFYPGDTGMDRVLAISNTAFDFGKPYTGAETGGGSGSGGSGNGVGGGTQEIQF